MGETAIKGRVGTDQPHESAGLHVSGEARYTDDIPEPIGTLHAAIGTSDRAHARIKSMNLEPVRRAPGVVAVITAEDVPGVNDIGGVLKDDPIFADRLVQYIGHSIFAVAATSMEHAVRAAQLAEIEYEELEPVLNVDDAMRRESFVLPTNHMGHGDPRQAIDRAAHRLEGRFRIGGQDQFYLESHIAFALPREGGDMLVHSSTQHPGEVQHVVAHALGRSSKDVVVECRRMGGGFGGKETQPSLFACVAALLAQATGRPVKMRPDRDADMIMTGKRHHQRFDYDVGFDDDGVIQGIEMTYASHCGMSADLSGPVNDRTMFHSDNAYYLPEVAITSHRCKTNTVSNTAFRGFGGPQGMMGIEYVVDEIARYLGIDPLDVRKRNLYGIGERNLTPYGMQIEDNVLHEIVPALETTSDYRVRRREIDEYNAGSEHLKRGLALTPVKFGISFTATHFNQAGALLLVYADGTVQLNHGGTEMGQGLFTKVAQVVAEELQIDIDSIRVTASDTAKVPNASATAASSGSDLNGMAALDAARKIKRRLTAFAAETWGVEPSAVVFDNGEVRVGDETVSVRRARPPRLDGSGAAVGHRLLPHAQDRLRPHHHDRPAVLLLRLRRGVLGGGDRPADRRVPGAQGRHPARRRQVAQPGDRPGPDRGRLHPGHGLADHRGAVVERGRGAPDPRALDLQDPGGERPAGGVQRRAVRLGQEPRADHPPLEGGGRAAADAGDLGLSRHQGRHRQRRRPPAEPAAGLAGHPRGGADVARGAAAAACRRRRANRRAERLGRS